jgi:hypothetical protein
MIFSVYLTMSFLNIRLSVNFKCKQSQRYRANRLVTPLTLFNKNNEEYFYLAYENTITWFKVSSNVKMKISWTCNPDLKLLVAFKRQRNTSAFEFGAWSYAIAAPLQHICYLLVWIQLYNRYVHKMLIKWLNIRLNMGISRLLT